MPWSRVMQWGEPSMSCWASRLSPATGRWRPKCPVFCASLSTMMSLRPFTRLLRPRFLRIRFREGPRGGLCGGGGSRFVGQQRPGRVGGDIPTFSPSWRCLVERTPFCSSPSSLEGVPSMMRMLSYGSLACSSPLTKGRPRPTLTALLLGGSAGPSCCMNRWSSLPNASSLMRPWRASGVLSSLVSWEWPPLTGSGSRFGS